MIKIVIADDHSLTREGLKSRISRGTNDMKVINEASNANELMRLLSDNLPDIVVLDISMPGKSGLDILKEIRYRYPEIKVLILSMHPEEQYAVRMIRAGAAGYLTKDNEKLPAEVIKAIRTIVIQNKRYISPGVANQLIRYIKRGKPKKSHQVLSDREYQVLCMIASGKKISEIAGEFAITVQTVHTYKKRIYNKLNLHNDAELIKYAIRVKLID